jgi:hypothetical protein
MNKQTIPTKVASRSRASSNRVRVASSRAAVATRVVSTAAARTSRDSKAANASNRDVDPGVLSPGSTAHGVRFARRNPGCRRSLSRTMHKEGPRTVETSVEARAGFLDRPVLIILSVSTALVILAFVLIYFLG